MQRAESNETNGHTNEGATLMTSGPTRRQIVRFALPIFWGNLFQQLYNVVDSLVVGNYLGSDALAAVSSSGNIIFLLVGLFGGVFTGAGVVISSCFGAQDRENMEKAIHTTVAFGLLSGVLLSGIGVLISPVLLRWIGTPESVFPNSVLYFRIYFSGMIFVAMYNTAMGILQAVGDSRHPLYYLIVSSMVNVVLDVVLIAVFHMGVDGAALATVISQAVSAALGFRRLLHTDGCYRVFPKKVRLDGPMLTRLLRMGIPAGLQNSIISIGNVFVQSGINAFGATAMAGSGAYSKIEGFAFLPVNAFAMALTTFISQNLGAKQYGRARRGSRFGVLGCMILAEAVALLVFLLAPWLASLFGGDAEMVSYGVLYARTVTPFFFLCAFSHAVAGIMRGAGKAAVPMIVMTFCWCLVRVTYISLFRSSFTSIRMVYAVYPVTWTLSSLVFLLFYLKGNWAPKAPASPEAE